MSGIAYIYMGHISRISMDIYIYIYILTYIDYIELHLHDQWIYRFEDQCSYNTFFGDGHVRT